MSVSNKSANILREIKKSGELNVQEKGVNDYVTKADFLSQLNIVKSLESMFPKMKFCGEEGVWKIYWIPKTLVRYTPGLKNNLYAQNDSKFI